MSYLAKAGYTSTLLLNPVPPTSADDTAGTGLPKILFVSSVLENQVALHRALFGTYRVLCTNTCHRALEILQKTPVPVVLCESALPDGTWLDMLQGIAGSRDAALLIVTSRMADDRLWAEVLNLGGFDLIATPFRESEVRHVVNTAWSRKHETVRPMRAAGIL